MADIYPGVQITVGKGDTMERSVDMPFHFKMVTLIMNLSMMGETYEQSDLQVMLPRAVKSRTPHTRNAGKCLSSAGIANQINQTEKAESFGLPICLARSLIAKIRNVKRRDSGEKSGNRSIKDNEHIKTEE